MLVMKWIEYRYWPQFARMGRRRFVWVYGVGMWGAFPAMFWAIIVFGYMTITVGVNAVSTGWALAAAAFFLTYAYLFGHWAWSIGDRRYRSSIGAICSACGYDLRGSAAKTCPECGHVLPSPTAGGRGIDPQSPFDRLTKKDRQILRSALPPYRHWGSLMLVIGVILNLSMAWRNYQLAERWAAHAGTTVWAAADMAFQPGETYSGAEMIARDRGSTAIIQAAIAFSCVLFLWVFVVLNRSKRRIAEALDAAGLLDEPEVTEGEDDTPSPT